MMLFKNEELISYLTALQVQHSLYEYIVYDTEARADEWAGVLIRKDGKIASHLQCRIGENSHLSHDAFYIPEREPFEYIDALP